MKKLLFVTAGIIAVLTSVVSAAGPLRTQWRLSDTTYAYGDIIYASGFSGGSSTSEAVTVGDANVTNQLTVGTLAGYIYGTVGVLGTTLNGGSWTGLNGAAISSGDIPSLRMTAYGVVVSDFTHDNYILVGTGVGAFGAESPTEAKVSLGLVIGTDVLAPDGDGSAVTALNASEVTSGKISTNQGGAGTLSGILKATSGVVSPAIADTDYVAVTSSFGNATSVNGGIASGQVIVTNAITMKDIAGNTQAGYALVHVWMSTNIYGTASTNNIKSLALTTGTEVEEVLAEANYWYVTAAAGTAIATIEATATGRNYINVGVGPRVTSTEIYFVP